MRWVVFVIILQPVNSICNGVFFLGGGGDKLFLMSKLANECQRDFAITWLENV
jgi:hypothetical protein